MSGMGGRYGGGGKRAAGVGFSRAVMVRALVYVLVLGYLLVDLWLWKGPLYRAFYERGEAQQLELGEGDAELVAKVFDEWIRVGDLRREVREQQWRTGELYAQAPRTRRRVLRLQALETLVVRAHVRELLEQYEGDFVLDEQRLEREWQQLLALWGGEQRARERLQESGWTVEMVRGRLREDLLAQLYFERLIEEDLAAVDEQRARDWYEDHRLWLRSARRARFGQLFRATLGRDSAQVEALVRGWMAQGRPEPGQPWPALELSEDGFSKQRRGSLGWMVFAEDGVQGELTELAEHDSLPAGLREQMAGMEPGEQRLARSEWGWHWLWMESEWVQGEALEFEQLRGEIMRHLRNMVRERELAFARKRLFLTAAREYYPAASAEFEEPIEGF